MRALVVISLALTGGGLAACGDDDVGAVTPTPTSDSGGGGTDPGQATLRAEVAGHLATEVIYPSLTRFEIEAGELVAATSAYADAPSPETRATAQAAWREAMSAWQRVEMMQLGPAGRSSQAMGGMDLRDEIYAWPSLSLCRVDQGTATDAHTSPDELETELINVRGLGAIEYLLFVESLENNCSPRVVINTDGTWAGFTPQQLEARRARHAHSLAVVNERLATRLRTAWDPAGGDFLGEITDPDAGTVYGTSQEALNAISDAMFYLDREVKDMKVGEPAGIAACAAMTCPESRESLYANHSRENALENLRAFQLLFLGAEPGTDAPGFDDVLRSRGADEFADRMAGNIETAINELEALDGTLVDALSSDLDAVVAAHTAIRAVTDDFKMMFLSVLDLEQPSGRPVDND